MGVRWGSGGGYRVDVNAMLGVGGDVWYGGCERRIEGIVKCTKRYCSILRKLKTMWGEWEGQYLNPKHYLCIKKKEQKKSKKKNVTEAGLEPTTSGLEKPALLSTRLNTIIAITKYEGEITIFI